MLYREAGDFKTSYAADAQTFPIRFDRNAFYLLVALALALVPLVINNYWSNAILLPFLIWSIAAIGLNILTGYCGQVSLGTGGFMAVGAFASFKLMTAFPDLNIYFAVVLAGAITAGVGIFFGLPSLRIKGFYLAVATLAAQFFLVWMFNKVPWFMNYSATGQINAPVRTVFGWEVTGAAAGPAAKYLFCLSFVIVLALIAKNLTRGRIGRSWMAIRDMDIAAEIIGVNPLVAKLSAFAVSSFFIGIAGALYFAVYFGAVTGLDPRLVPRCGLHRADADRTQECHGRRARLADRPRRACGVHAARRADHVLPHRRAARAGPALAADQGEAASLAVPALSGAGPLPAGPARTRRTTET